MTVSPEILKETFEALKSILRFQGGLRGDPDDSASKIYVYEEGPAAGSQQDAAHVEANPAGAVTESAWLSKLRVGATRIWQVLTPAGLTAWLDTASADRTAFVAALSPLLSGSYQNLTDKPRYLARFAAIDGDTVPSSDLTDGKIGLYAADGVTEHQNGDIAGIGVIYLPRAAAAFSANAADPGTDLDTYDLARFGDLLIDNAGSSVIIALKQYGQTTMVWFQADQVESYGTQGYKLSELHHLKGSYTPSSAGVGWQVVAAITEATSVANIIDLDKLVSRTDLEGHEDDSYAGSYDEGLLQATQLDKRFAWAVASTDGSAAPAQADIYNEAEDIVAGARTLIVGATQFATIPDEYSDWPPTPTKALTADLVAALRNVHSASPPDKANYPIFVPSGVATKVGAGNGAYFWIPVTITIHGSLASIPGEEGAASSANGNVWRLSAEEPSTLEIDLPYQAIGNPPWALRTLALLPAAAWQNVVAGLESLTGSWLKRLRLLVQGNNESQTLRIKRVAVNPTAAGEISLANLNNGIGQLILWPPATTKDGTPFDVDDLKEYKSSDFLSYGSLEWVIGDTPWIKFGIGNTQLLTASVFLADGYTYNAADLPALDAYADFVLEGRDIHLGLVIPAILKRSSPNIGGNGGAAGRLWAYLTSATDATWRRLLDVLKADADNAAKKADYQAALATGRLSKDIAGNSDVTLAAAEAAYDSIEFIGAKTGEIVVTLPAAPSGPRMLVDSSTGAHALKVKASGQADAAALVLDSGPNLILHEGGALKWPPPVRSETAELTVTNSDQTILTDCADTDWIVLLIWEAAASPGPNDKMISVMVRHDKVTTAGIGVLVEDGGGSHQAILTRGTGSDAGKLSIRKGGGLADPVKAIAARMR